MFEHVTLLLSFVYAVALTHLLSTATELLIARQRVRLCGLYTAWLLIALLMLLVNWMSFWGLVAIKRWTVFEVLLQFLLAIIQYFTCSAFRIAEARGDECIDLRVIYQERRTLIAGAFLALGLLAAFQNWWDRNNVFGLKAADWIGEDLTVAPMIVGVIIAGWARPLWLQWVAAATMFASVAYFLATYAIPGT